jgi:putative sterol carrier protein
MGLADKELEERLTSVMPRLGGIGAIVAFDFGEDGRYVVDARGAVAKIAGADSEPACTIKASGATMRKLIDGSLDPMLAYTLGKLKISGSMGVAMKLASTLSE